MELRKDYLLDRWVIIATERSKRPHQFKASEKLDSKDGCYFCPGNEHLTPLEIGRVSNGLGWKFRWFANKFAAVAQKGNPQINTQNDFFTFASAFGYHEVIVDTPNHEEQLWDLSKDSIKELFRIYNSRINELSKKENIKYVQVFKNHGKEGGTSIAHSHTQIVALSFIPDTIKQKTSAVSKFTECPYCKIINIEKSGERKCFENDRFVAFAPYASRFPMEIWVMPKKHLRSLSEFDDKDYNDVAEIMKNIFTALKDLNSPYNFYIHYSPYGDNLHLAIEIIPRTATWAGFEYSTNTIINITAPEDAARFYREEGVIHLQKCTICNGEFHNSPDELVLCEHKNGFVHLGCCVSLCSGDGKPCKHCKGVYGKITK